jgi:hypothetical protein
MVKKIARVVASLLASAVEIYSVYLIFVGNQISGVAENSTEVITSYTPRLEAIIPLIAGSLIFAGVAVLRPWLYWSGLAILTVFAGLFLFGIGGIFLPVCAVLFWLLLTLQVTK